jgi:serine/threonine protein kinase
VLIFEEEGRGYCAKITDFGYSTVYAHPDDNISMPMSYPWCPPEQDRSSRLWTPSEAKSMDIFSFGMLCVWFPSDRSLADMRMVYEAVWLRPASSGFGSEDDLKEFLGFLKSHDLLLTCADAMMNGLATVDASLAEEWREVFRRSLSTSPKDRNIDGLSLFLGANGSR